VGSLLGITAYINKKQMNCTYLCVADTASAEHLLHKEAAAAATTGTGAAPAATIT